MSVKIMSLVWEHAHYSEGSLLVLLALADWADDSGHAWPSIPRLAFKARLERRQVQRILRKLEDDGILEVKEGRGRGHQNEYLINREKLKGDIMTPFREIKGDIDDQEKASFGTQKATLKAEKATFRTQKAALVSPDPLEEPSVTEPSKEPSGEPSNGYPYHGPVFLDALEQYEQHRKEIRKPLRATGRKALYAQLETYGEHGAVLALRQSIANGWTGVFPPKGNGKARGMDAVREVLAELEGAH